MNQKSYLPLIILLVVSFAAVFLPAVPTEILTKGTFPDGKPWEISAGDTAWMLTATAFVLLMTPGLAYFYGGMVNMRNVISTMLQSFVSMGVISVLWIVVGFSLAFGDSIGGFIGDPTTFFMFRNVLDAKAPWSLAPTIPLALFAFFQLKFAIITPALITGSFAERVNFKGYVLFIVLFSLIVYSPLAHWTWHPEGFLFKLGVLDFAGGTVVHMSAGWAALAAAIFLKKRKSMVENEVHPPANIPFVLLGTGLLWFGWFGFNAGSAVGAGTLAVSAFATTNIAAAAAGLSWVLFDVAKGKKLSALGFCIGAVVGLVAITPAAGFVTIPTSIFIGTAAGIISNIIAHWKAKSGKIDDTLDVFPCHGVGGMVGMVMTGIFATSTVNSAVVENGLAFGETALFLKHMLALVIVSVFAFVVSYILLVVTNAIVPLRVSEEEERLGLDVSQHDEVLMEA
ncbi:ammonium transporter [Cytophagaceae bacterium DM2B3-1]|uniref:Ammonium transporter n=1 Tax=Xanthocytophaga flava TaxID=3048013 RepID=A0ABT7CHR7_9BACT|nr:ammonium transporter [Xanthocytophaga flavus]MDJ1493240.1 ammonium transporter [Xanthocytophaga flavus]